jgi:hypothetical protein
MYLLLALVCASAVPLVWHGVTENDPSYILCGVAYVVTLGVWFFYYAWTVAPAMKAEGDDQ